MCKRLSSVQAYQAMTVVACCTSKHRQLSSVVLASVLACFRQTDQQCFQISVLVSAILLKLVLETKTVIFFNSIINKPDKNCKHWCSLVDVWLHETSFLNSHSWHHLQHTAQQQPDTWVCVTVSSDLHWHKHVNNVSAKATKTLNFIRRNVYCCSPDTKATAYISLVRSYIEYAAAAWDPYLIGNCKQLEKVQRRDYRSTTSVSSLISQLGWQTLSDRRRNSRIITHVQESSHSGWYFHLTFSSFFQAHSFSLWRHILCLVLSNQSLQLLLLSSYHCWLECPPGICEVSSFHSYVPLCDTFQLNQHHLTTLRSRQ